jgi:hemolysin activation/secretion protein
MHWPLQTRSQPRHAGAPGSSRRVCRVIGLRPGRRPVSLGLMLVVGLTSVNASAQLLLLPESLGPSVYTVSAIDLAYTEEHPDQPPLDALLPIEVELRPTEDGWGAPREGEPSETRSVGGPESETIRLEAGGLARVLRTIVAALHDQGLYGIDVRPAASDIDLESERDLRPDDRTTLGVIVTVGRVKQIRTIAVGDRVKSDWKIDNEVHNHIRDNSPLQATGVADGEQTDLLDRDRLENYLFRLNRHAGRRVEAALSPASEPGGIVLDYRVLEAKPWYAYAQAANTGTRRSSPWQARLGVAHRQLTDRDDILTIEYLNAGLDDVNGIRARYQAPFFGPKRPVWMNRRKGDPGWLDWVPRDEIPWFGIDRLRWEVDFGWGKARAGRSSTLQGLANDPVRSNQFQYGGRFIYEALQFGNFFVDTRAGLRLRDVDVRNQFQTGSSSGDALFVIPVGGIHAERINQVSTFGLDVALQGSVSSVSEGNLDGLGRDSTDDKYMILDFNLGYSTFLEPLLRPAAWGDPSTESSSTLAHELALGVRGQYAFDYRLVPQASQTLGGLYSVRGYDQSVAVGDTIIIGSIEYRFHVPRALPVAREPLRIPFVGDFRAAPQQAYGRPDWDFTLRAFLDVGRALRNDRSSTPAGANEYNQTLIGAGVGAELLIKSNFRARLDWATALKGTHGPISNSSEVGDSELYVLFSILY